MKAKCLLSVSVKPTLDKLPNEEKGRWAQLAQKLIEEASDVY